MSNFLTPIPVHLDKIKALLPPGSTVDELKWNPKTNSVDLFWHNGALKTKYLWAWPFPLLQLEKQQMPEGVEEALSPYWVPPLSTNVLTDQPDQTKTKQREKLAGKLHKSKGPHHRHKSARHSTPAPSPVDGIEPATTGGVSTVIDRE